MIIPDFISIKEVKKQYIIGTLKKCNNNISLAIDTLKIGRTTLWRRLKEYKYEIPKIISKKRGNMNRSYHPRKKTRVTKLSKKERNYCNQCSLLVQCKGALRGGASEEYGYGYGNKLCMRRKKDD